MSASIQLQHPVPGAHATDAYGWRAAIPGVVAAQLHNGQDYAAAAGTPILAAHDGTVTNRWWDTIGGSPGGGNMIRIDGNGFSTSYAHMQAQSPLPIGTRVRAGDVIGYVGSTGAATGAHLHFMLLYGGSWVDPVPYITGGGSTPSTQTRDEDTMIRFQSPGRGIALGGAGYYRHLTTDEEVQQSGPLISAHFSGNDRQFDLWASMCLSGTAANSAASNSIWKYMQDAWKQAHGFFQTLLGRAPSTSTGGVTDDQIETIAKRLNENLAKNEYVITGVATPKGK